MSVRVKIPTLMRDRTGGAAVVEASGDTVGAVLADLEARFPGATDKVVDAEGALHRFVNVYVNGEDIRFAGSLGATVRDGDTVTILPAVAGG
ncbi:MAG: MoaD family protein [Actinomycetota bacterium]